MSNTRITKPVVISQTLNQYYLLLGRISNAKLDTPLDKGAFQPVQVNVGKVKTCSSKLLVRIEAVNLVCFGGPERSRRRNHETAKGEEEKHARA